MIPVTVATTAYGEPLQLTLVGEPFGEYLAVIPSIADDVEDLPHFSGSWAILHRPTGWALTSAPTIDLAREAAHQLASGPIDWNRNPNDLFEDPEVRRLVLESVPRRQR